MGWDVGRQPVARATEMMEGSGGRAELGGKYAVLTQSHRNEGGALGAPWLSQVLQSPRRATAGMMITQGERGRQLPAGRGAWKPMARV